MATAFSAGTRSMLESTIERLLGEGLSAYAPAIEGLEPAKVGMPPRPGALATQLFNTATMHTGPAFSERGAGRNARTWNLWLGARGHSSLRLPLPQNEPIPGVMHLQQRFVMHVPGQTTATPFTDGVLVDAGAGATAAAAAASAAPDAGSNSRSRSRSYSLSFDLVQAPTSFSLPAMQKRPWTVPFKVGGGVPPPPCLAAVLSWALLRCCAPGRPAPLPSRTDQRVC